MDKNLKLDPNPVINKPTRHVCRRNKNAGDSFELEVVKELRLIGYPYAVTTRAENPKRDDQKVDIMNADEYKHGRMPFNFQCKNMATNTEEHGIKYPLILSQMPKGPEINVVIHNQTVKRGSRFITRGQYAFLKMTDFFNIVGRFNQLQEAFELLNAYFDYIPDEHKEQLAAKLEALGQK